MAEDKQEKNSGLELDFPGFISDEVASALDPEGKEKKDTEIKEDFNSVLESRVAVKKEEIKDTEVESTEGKEDKEVKSTKAAGEEKEKPLSQNTEQSEDNSKIFSLAFAKVLAERGVISELSDERLKELEQTYKENEDIGNYAVFEKIIADEVSAIRGEMLESYEEDVKEYIDMIDAGVDKDRAMDIMKDRKVVDSITDEQLSENEELRKNVLFNYYKATTKFSPDKINKMIDNLATTGEDIDEAKTALGELKDIHKQRIEEEKQRVQDEEKVVKERIESQRKQYVETIDKMDEIFKGIKIEKNTKATIKDMILKPAGKDAQGNPLNAVWLERSKNPVEFDARLAYLISKGAFKGDFSKLGKIGASKSVEELEQVMKTTSKTTINPSVQTVTKDKDVDKNIKALENLFTKQ